MANGLGSPDSHQIPGLTSEGTQVPTAISTGIDEKKLRENIANLSPGEYLDRLLDRAARELPNIGPEALKGSAERVSSYLSGKLQGIDGQPLSDSAAEAALASIRLERGDHVNRALLEIAGNLAETGQQSRDAALDTILMGAAIDPEADSPWGITKIYLTQQAM